MPLLNFIKRLIRSAIILPLTAGNPTHGSKCYDGRISTIMIMGTIASVSLVVMVISERHEHGESSLNSYIYAVITACDILGGLSMLVLGICARKMQTGWIEPLKENEKAPLLKIIFIWLFGFIIILWSLSMIAINSQCNINDSINYFFTTGQRITWNCLTIICISLQIVFISYFSSFTFCASFISHLGIIFVVSGNMAAGIYCFVKMSENLFTPTQNFTIGAYNFGNTIQALGANSSSCSDHVMYTKFLIYILPFYRPVTVEYSLLAIGLMFGFWSSTRKLNKTNACTFYSPPIRNNRTTNGSGKIINNRSTNGSEQIINTRSTNGSEEILNNRSTNDSEEILIHHSRDGSKRIINYHSTNESEDNINYHSTNESEDIINYHSTNESEDIINYHSIIDSEEIKNYHSTNDSSETKPLLHSVNDTENIRPQESLVANDGLNLQGFQNYQQISSRNLARRKKCINILTVLLGILITAPIYTVTALLVFSSAPTEGFRNGSEWLYVLFCIILFLTDIVALYKLQEDCDHIGENIPLNGSEYIFIVTCFADVAYNTFGILASVCSSGTLAYLLRVQSVILIFVDYLQAILVLQARRSRKRNRFSYFGIENVCMLLALLNGCRWLVGSLAEIKYPFSTIQEHSFSRRFWTNVVHIVFPIANFYRFHTFIDAHQLYKTFKLK